MRVCLVCGDTLPDEASFCVNCGGALDRPEGDVGGVYRCHYHGERFALSRCSLCGRMICRSCINHYAGRDVCNVCYMREIVPELALGRVRWLAREGAI